MARSTGALSVMISPLMIRSLCVLRVEENALVENPQRPLPETDEYRPVRSYGRVKFPSGVSTVKSPRTR